MTGPTKQRVSSVCKFSKHNTLSFVKKNHHLQEQCKESKQAVDSGRIDGVLHSIHQAHSEPDDSLMRSPCLFGVLDHYFSTRKRIVSQMKSATIR